MTLLCTVCMSTGRHRSVCLWFYLCHWVGKERSLVGPNRTFRCEAGALAASRAPPGREGASQRRDRGTPLLSCGASSMRVAVTCPVHPLSRASGRMSASGLHLLPALWQAGGAQEPAPPVTTPRTPARPAPAPHPLPSLFILLESLFFGWWAVIQKGHPQADGRGWRGMSVCPWLGPLPQTALPPPPHHPPTHTHFSFAGLKVGWQHVSSIHSLRRLLRKGTCGKQKDKEARSWNRKFQTLRKYV